MKKKKKMMMMMVMMMKKKKMMMKMMMMKMMMMVMMMMMMMTEGRPQTALMFSDEILLLREKTYSYCAELHTHYLKAWRHKNVWPCQTGRYAKEVTMDMIHRR